MAEITLSRGLVAIVDDELADALLANRWHAFVTQAGRAYARRCGPKNTAIYMHRQILEAPQGLVVDHINGNTLDNRRANLRLADLAQNGWNSVGNPRRSLTYKGIYRRNGRFVVRIIARRVTHWVGTFDTEEEAALAYNEAAQRLHGEFARLNIVGGAS